MCSVSWIIAGTSDVTVFSRVSYRSVSINNLLENNEVQLPSSGCVFKMFINTSAFNANLTVHISVKYAWHVHTIKQYLVVCAFAKAARKPIPWKRIAIGRGMARLQMSDNHLCDLYSGICSPTDQSIQNVTEM